MIEFQFGIDESGGTPLQLFLTGIFEHSYLNSIRGINRKELPEIIDLINSIVNHDGAHNYQNLFQYQSTIYHECYKSLDYYKEEIQKTDAVQGFPNTEAKLDSIVRHKNWIAMNSKIEYLPVLKYFKKRFSSINTKQSIYDMPFDEINKVEIGKLIIKEIVEIQFDILNTIIASMQKVFRLLIAEYLGRFADEFPGGLSTHILTWNNDKLDIDHFIDKLVSMETIETFPSSSPKRMKEMIKAHFEIISNEKRIPPQYSNISLQKIIWKGKRKHYVETVYHLIDKDNKVITVDHKTSRDVVLSELHEIFVIPEYSGRGNLKLGTIQTLFKLYLHDPELFHKQNP